MSELAPYDPPQPPEQPSGDGPVELWRRANAATRGTIVAVLVVLLVVGSFLAGRLSAPDGDEPAGAAPSAPVAEATPDQVATAIQQDDEAKDVARDLATFVESCATGSLEQSYSGCRTKAQLNVGSTLPLVDGRQAGAGEAAVTSTRDGYRIVSVSASGNAFVLARDGGTEQTARTCTDTGVPNAGCVGSVW